MNLTILALALAIANTAAIAFLAWRFFRAPVNPSGLNEAAVRRIAKEYVEPRIAAWEKEEARREAEQEAAQIARFGVRIKPHGKE